MIMYNASIENGHNNSSSSSNSNSNNNNNSNLITTNSTEIYWQFAAPRLSSDPAELTAAVYQQLSQSYHSGDNQTQPLQAEPPPFYTSFNISDDLFDYFNGFIGGESGGDGTTELLPSSSEFNYSSPSTTPDPVFSDFLEALPNDRVSLLSFLFLFSFATVFGNSLVILAVIRERYLHTATNYFITSLAVADCLVGLVVMPFSALYEVLENTWFFGTDWCDIWRSLDVLFSTASILNLCVISLDRYWAITDPFSYPMRMTVKRAAGLICAVWVCSGAISFPAIVWWRAARDGEMPAYKCTFTEHLGYLVFSSTISFYLPLLVMVFTYCRIYRAAVIQTRSLKIGTKQVLMASGELQLTLRIHRGGTTREPATSSHHQALHGGGGSSAVGGSQHHSHSHHHSAHHNHSVTGTTTSTPEEPDDEPLSALHNNGLARHRHMGKNFSLSRKLAKFAKEKKAAKTLGIVMGVFIVCWLPFFVVNLLSGFCMECIEHEEIVSAVVTWLGWINSCMNPVIYACWSRDFRRAFVRLLCMCCPRKIRRKYQPTMRSKSQLSSCSSCSSSSNCGRNGVHHHHHHQQLQQQQRERSCTRCQSFHRHHHRQRRRSSGIHQLQRNDFAAAASSANSAASITSTIQAIVNITPSMDASTSGAAALSTVPKSATAPVTPVTPVTPLPATKHCTFALTPTTIPPPPNQVSFLATARYHPSLRPKSSLSPSQTPAVTPLPTPTAINASLPSLAELASLPPVVGNSFKQKNDSVAIEDDDIDDIVEEPSTSSSMSSLDQQTAGK